MAPTPITEVVSVVDPDGAFYSGSLLGLIILIIDLMAVVQVLNSERSVLSKLLWCLFIFSFPFFGILIYYIFAERERRRLRYVSIP